MHLHKRQVDNRQLQQQQHAAHQPDAFVAQQAGFREKPSLRGS
jgi:hypothetical protein